MLGSRQSCLLLIALSLPLSVLAQDAEPSLGEVAREARQAKAPETANSSQKVIDNDNFSAVLDQAEAARVTGKPVFSIDPSGNAFRMTSPDGTCSLSFDAKATSLISSSFVSSDLPQDDLVKLEGHAVIHDDVLEVSVHNGSPWEVRELVIGVTVLQRLFKEETDLADAKMATDPSWTGKTPDSTSILHLRGSVAADQSGTFTAVLSSDSTISLSSNADWHWALVSARGIPPASAPSTQSAAVSSAPVAADSSAQPPASPTSASLSASPAAPAPSH